LKEPIIIIIIITSSGMLNSFPNPDNASMTKKIVKELRHSEWKIPPLLRVVLYRMLLLRNGFWEFASQRRRSFEARAPESPARHAVTHTHQKSQTPLETPWMHRGSFVMFRV
jgi:hypothetical protein